LKKILSMLDPRLGTLSTWLNRAAAGALMAMMVLVNANVILRPFGKPIWGTYEIVGFMGTLVLSLALIQTTYNQGHMAVEVLTRRLPRRIRSFIRGCNNLISMIVMILIAWQSLRYGTRVLYSGEVSATLRLPFYPFLYAIALSFGVAALVLLMLLVKSFLSSEEK
jgi:TRAP-type C4-dicarboxylate transport system permease small subunit